MALAHVQSKTGEKCDSPKDRRPNSDRSGKEPGCDDSEKKARVGPKQESGSASESEH